MFFSIGLGLIMGQKINNKYLICLDLDNKEGVKSNGIYYKNGVEKWKDILKSNNHKTTTITAKTPSKGLHFFYLIGEEDLDLFESSFTGLFIDGEWYNIDMKLKNQFIFIEPTFYYKNNELLKYEFRHTDISKLEDVPKFLLDIMRENLNVHRCNKNITKTISNKDKTKSKEIKYIVEEIRIIEKTSEEELVVIKEILDLMNNIKLKDDLKSWLAIGYALYNLGCSYELWDEWSKGVDKYKMGECQKRFEGFKRKHITNGIHTLLYYLKNDIDYNLFNKMHSKVYNIEKWKRNKNMHLFNSWTIEKIYDDGKEYNVKNYNLQFLCDENKKISKIKNPENDKEYFLNDVFNFHYDDKYKTLSIKSAYGTGKTSFLKNFLNMLDMNDTKKYKRVLFVSYRRSLSYDVKRQLKEFGFENYIEVQKERKFLHEVDKLIIQYESLYKILNNCYDLNDEPNDISYDLIIIDECESVLTQVESSTNGENQEEKYDILRQLINKSKKMIVLDGDISNKTYNFIHTFSDHNILIKNIYSGTKKIIITKNYDNYIQNIQEDLKQNKKLYICCMSINDGNELRKRIEEQFNNKIIKFINADMSDAEKEQIYNDVNAEWIKYDVIITTPITEAGVSFDLKNHFHKIYAMLNSGSTTPRGLMQMLNRVRYPTITDVIIYANNLKLHNNIIFYTYNDVKKIIYENIREDKNYIPYIVDKEKGFVLKNKTHYLENHIFNETEKLNAQSYYFLAYFKLLCKEKNIIFIYDDEKGKQKFIAKNIKKEKIIDAKIITKEEYEDLSEKIKKCQNITEEERYEYLKYGYFVKKLKYEPKDLENLTDKQKDEFNYLYSNKNTPKNFFLLIDEVNSKKFNFDANNNYKSIEKINEINDIKEFLNLYGIKNPAKTNELFDFKKKMEKNKTKNIFNEKHIIANKKKLTDVDMLWNVKNTLAKYGLDIKNDRKQERKENERKWVDNYVLKIDEKFESILKKILVNFECSDQKNFLHNLTDKIYDISSLFDEYDFESEIYDIFELSTQNIS
jgi:hypothetical protein